MRDLEGPETIFQLLAEGLQSDFSSIRTLRARTLPVARSSFIGRQAEREQLHQMVKAEALVTLTGIGGCGKTRLALEVASDVEGDFADGAFFVDLSAVSDPTLVGQAVAGALGLQIPDPTPDALADYFTERQTLLLLDNCEHLLDACGDLAEALLGERCPELRILGTSREPLSLEGERVFGVPSLDIEAEATALFAERALGARLGLRIDSRSEATITEICQRLDGIPLAIELAATQAAHLSLEEILERLNDRFRLLVGGRRRIQRQQTLSAALDWSYDLLAPDEQLLLRRLAVFRGSFSLRAAEAVCHPKAMELLGSLVAKSLVSVIDRGEGVRYRLLESVRIYAEGKLVETGESEQLRAAHRDFYLEWVESLSPDELRGLRIHGTSALVSEADNLTAALEWCRQQRQYDLCARIAVRMAGYWSSFVRISELMGWWQELDARIPAEDRDHRALVFLLGALAAFWLGGDRRELIDLFSAQAYSLADPHSWVYSEALYLQAGYWARIDPRRSERVYEQAFEIDASLGLSLDTAMYDAYQMARLSRAKGREEALVLLGDWRAGLGDSTPTHAMACAFALYGETRTALELKPRAEPASRGIRHFVAELSEAVIASAQGRFDEAEQHLATLASDVRDTAMPRGEVGCLVGFAKVALDRGDYARASRLLAAANPGALPGYVPFRHAMDTTVYIHCAGCSGTS